MHLLAQFVVLFTTGVGSALFFTTLHLENNIIKLEVGAQTRKNALGGIADGVRAGGRPDAASVDRASGRIPFGGGGPALSHARRGVRCQARGQGAGTRTMVAARWRTVTALWPQVEVATFVRQLIFYVGLVMASVKFSFDSNVEMCCTLSCVPRGAERRAARRRARSFISLIVWYIGDRTQVGLLLSGLLALLGTLGMHWMARCLPRRPQLAAPWPQPRPTGWASTPFRRATLRASTRGSRPFSSGGMSLAARSAAYYRADAPSTPLPASARRRHSLMRLIGIDGTGRRCQPNAENAAVAKYRPVGRCHQLGGGLERKLGC